MCQIKRYWLFLFLLFGSSIHSKELLLVAGLEKPPYVIPTIDSGFEVEMMQEVLSTLDHKISVVYVPYGRTYEIMKQIKADIGLTLTASSGVKSDILTVPYVVYQNVAISLKPQKIEITKVTELQSYSLVAFQNAHKILGSEFDLASKLSPLYFELPDQKRQVELLLDGRVEVIVMDINIFKYFSKLIVGSSQLSTVNVHSIFPSTYYRAAIGSDTLRQSFNQAVTEYVKTDQYNKLLEKYDMPYLLSDRLPLLLK